MTAGTREKRKRDVMSSHVAFNVITAHMTCLDRKIRAGPVKNKRRNMPGNKLSRHVYLFLGFNSSLLLGGGSR